MGIVEIMYLVLPANERKKCFEMLIKRYTRILSAMEWKSILNALQCVKSTRYRC